MRAAGVHVRERVWLRPLHVCCVFVGARLFGRVAGALFAFIVFTRATFISLAGQAPIDVPFVAFILMAAALEVQRPRRGGAVFMCLTLAGLLRPEAWLFAAAYALYLLPACDDARSRRARSRPRPRPSPRASGPRCMSTAARQPARPASARRPAARAVNGVRVGRSVRLAVALTGLPVLSRYHVVPVVMVALFAAVALAGWCGLVRADAPRAGARALVIRPASPQVAATFASATTPAWSASVGPRTGWHELYRNRSWVLYETAPAT